MRLQPAGGGGRWLREMFQQTTKKGLCHLHSLSSRYVYPTQSVNGVWCGRVSCVYEVEKGKVFPKYSTPCRRWTQSPLQEKRNAFTVKVINNIQLIMIQWWVLNIFIRLFRCFMPPKRSCDAWLSADQSGGWGGGTTSTSAIHRLPSAVRYT